METLIVAEEHRNQRSIGHHRHDRRNFKQINCRTTFQSGVVGLLPRPKGSSSSALPQVQSPRSPKSVLPVFSNHRTSPIPIKGASGIRRCASEVVDVKRRSFSSYSELWAGPTYSNSPPPTSVPIPKFSLKQKRSLVTLSFPSPDSGVKIREVAKSVSAPVSPTSSGDDNNNNPFRCTVSATMTLRRMLNLETADE